MFILRSPHRAYDTRYLLICNDDFSQKIGGKIDVHTLKYIEFMYSSILQFYTFFNKILYLNDLFETQRYNYDIFPIVKTF